MIYELGYNILFIYTCLPMYGKSEFVCPRVRYVFATFCYMSALRLFFGFFFFKQKTAYEMIWWLEFRRVLFRSAVRRIAGLASWLDPRVGSLLTEVFGRPV